MIIISTIFIVLSFFSSQPKTEDTIDYLDNYINYITNTKMSQFRSSYKFIYNDPYEPDPDLSVQQKIFVLYTENATTKISGFIGNFSAVVIPDNVGVEYELNGTVLYQRNNDTINYSNTQFSRSIVTYFYADGVINGPVLTKVTMWS